MTLLDLLIDLVRLPYESLKRLRDESSVGASEEDRKSLRLWKWVAWIGTALILGVPLVLWLVFKWLLS